MGVHHPDYLANLARDLMRLAATAENPLPLVDAARALLRQAGVREDRGDAETAG